MMISLMSAADVSRGNIKHTRGCNREGYLYETSNEYPDVIDEEAA